MGVKFFVDVLDSAGNQLGSGPIASALNWKNIKRMDRAGEFAFAMPANDEKAALIVQKLRVRCRAILASGVVEFGGGIIDKISYTPSPDGVLLEVSGDDLMRELVYRSVGFTNYASGSSPVSHSSAVSTTIGFAPAGWTATADGSVPNNNFYYKATGESVLTLFGKIAEQCRTHFYMNANRSITFANSFASSGLRAMEATRYADINETGICFIKNLKVLNDSYDTISRIYPYGKQRSDGTYIKLDNCTRAAPTGYTLDTVNNYIKKDATEVTYGRIEDYVQYKEIDELTAGLTDKQSASNAVFDAALKELTDRSAVAQFYDLELYNCGQTLRPLQSIQVVYRRVVNGITMLNINQTLNIIEAQVEINSDGIQTTRLTVGSVARWPDSGAQAIVRSELQRQFK